MTPASHTLYAMTLFLALTSLKLWAERRQRLARVPRGDLKQILNPE